MIPKQAIEKAIWAGWHKEAGSTIIYNDHVSFDDEYINNNQIALDPTFWQALGKALGWGGKKWEPTVESGEYLLEWEDSAHVLYHLILTGGDTEKFWDEILSII